MKHNHRRIAKQNARKLDKMINHMYHIEPNGEAVKSGRDAQRANVKGSK